MMKPLKLYLALADFEELCNQADKRSKKITVDKQALSGLLLDHSRVIARLEDMRVPIEENYAESSTIRKTRERG